MNERPDKQIQKIAHLIHLEGMASGNPVVASGVDARRDSSTGFLVAPGDTARFANCVCRLVEGVVLRSRMCGAASGRPVILRHPGSSQGIRNS
ncbi:MAG: glycosyltransferase [Lentisphaerales bacterium]|nr:MAG: glycosyltransferase [Lentisphaerales bacterium]